MKWLWAGVLLLAGHTAALAQNAPIRPDSSVNAPVSATGITPPSTSAVAAPAQPNFAFELAIEAPDDIRDLLGRHLELLRYRELTDLSDSELLRLLQEAAQNTRDLVATLGYFAPDIKIELLPDRAAPSRQVKLAVVPGEPTVVTDVAIEFTGPIANDPAAAGQRQLIQDTWLLRPNMRFSQTRWDAAKQQVLRQLTTERYPTGQLSTTVADIDPLTMSARLAVTLASGPEYRLGDLVIEGNQRYSTQLVTRLARLTPGASYDQAQLVAAQQRLADSGYFNSAYLTLDTTGDPAAAPVRLQLREARLQKIILGVGASTDGGPRVSAEHTHHQVPGLGWRAVSKLAVDREAQSISTELTAPPDASFWRWVTAAEFKNEQVGSFDVSSQTLRVGRSQIGDRIDRNYYLQYDRAGTATSDATEPDVAAALSANYAWTLRYFDSLPFPSSGWGLGLELGGGTTLGNSRDPYGRVASRLLAYLPLDRSDSVSARRAGRLALRAEAGAVVATQDITLPSTQLFLTGGDNSVRGYSYRSIGVTLPDGQTTAGRYLALASVEWQRPIMANGRLTDWESTVFIDAGAVADKPAELHAKVGVGVGARWKSPVGPLQVDLAYGVAVKKLRLHLSVGFSF